MVVVVVVVVVGCCCGCCGGCCCCGGGGGSHHGSDGRELGRALWAVTSFLEAPNRPLSNHKKWSSPAPCAPCASPFELPGPNSRPTTNCLRQSCLWEAVGFPLTAEWRELLLPTEAKMRPAQLPVHSQNYSSLRKRSFKSACRRAVAAQQPVSYRGQQLRSSLYLTEANS